MGAALFSESAEGRVGRSVTNQRHPPWAQPTSAAGSRREHGGRLPRVTHEGPGGAREGLAPSRQVPSMLPWTSTLALCVGEAGRKELAKGRVRGAGLTGGLGGSRDAGDEKKEGRAGSLGFAFRNPPPPPYCRPPLPPVRVFLKGPSGPTFIGFTLRGGTCDGSKRPAAALGAVGAVVVMTEGGSRDNKCETVLALGAGFFPLSRSTKPADGR